MGSNGTKSLGGGAFPSLSDNANHSARLLVVDDDFQIRVLIAGYLTKAAYKVDTASDGAEAWDSLNGADYNLLITDHQMPMMTGLELIKKLRSENMTLPVILVSGTIPLEEIDRHPELCIVATLQKPFNASELLTAVQQALSPLKRSPIGDLSVTSEAASPTAEISRVQQPSTAPIISQINTSHRILVVDDDPDLRQLSIEVLAAANYHVEGVEDGAAGWDVLQANKHYDLIITDNHMPKVTGIELIEKLRAARLTPKVIMATEILPTHEFARRPWLKPDAMLERPYTNDDLLQTVRRVLRSDNGNVEETSALNPV